MTRVTSIVRLKEFYSRLKELPSSFLGLTYGFKVMIASDMVVGLTSVGFLSIWAKLLGATDMEIGTIYAAGHIVMFLVQIPGGALGLRFEKKRLYVFSLAAGFFTAFLIFMAKDWWWLLSAVIVENIGSIAAPALDALVAEVTLPATRATALATQSTIMSLVGIVNSPTMGYLADAMGVRPLYCLQAAGASVSCVLILALFPTKRFRGKETAIARGANSERVSLREAWKILMTEKRNVLSLLGNVIVHTILVTGFFPFISIYYRFNLAWSFTFIGFFGMVPRVTRILVQIPWGKIVDKVGRKTYLILSHLAAVAQWFLFIYVTDPWLLLIIVTVSTLLGAGRHFVINAFQYDTIPTRVYPVWSSIRNTVSRIGRSIGGFLGAYIWSTVGPPASFTLMAAGYLGAAIMLVGLREKRPQIEA